MGKRYNKSESRKGQPYNKSRRRRPHPPYDESKSRTRARAAEALELERENALDFDLNVPDANLDVPDVDWELPTIPDIKMGELGDALEVQTDRKTPPTKPKPKLNDPLELPEFEVKPKSNKPQVKVKPKQPQSLGQKPKPLTREQQIQREMQRRQAAQQQQRPQMQRKKGVHPAAIMGPMVIMFVVLAFLSTTGVSAIAYLFVLFFFGRHIWSIVQGEQKK